MNPPVPKPTPKVRLTHAEGRLEGLAEALLELGLEVVHTPLIGTRTLASPTLSAQARDLIGCDWLLFTSRSAVRAWCDLGLPLRGTPKSGPKLGAVGSATATDIRLAGGKLSLSAHPQNAQGLVDTFTRRVAPPQTVGFPCSQSALPTLQMGLTRAGFEVRRLPIYESVIRPWSLTNGVLGGEMIAEIVVLASPSAVSALPQTLGAGPRAATFVALGPSTGEALGSRGWRYLQAPTPNAEGVVQVVAQHLRLTPPALRKAAPRATDTPSPNVLTPEHPT